MAAARRPADLRRSARAGHLRRPIVRTVQVSIDALVIPEVLPFWRAVLGYEYRADSPEEDLIDPLGRGAPFWFQQVDAPRPQRNRIHIDIWCRPTRPRRASLRRSPPAATWSATSTRPKWWTLAVAEGNEVEVATTRGRD